jgi:hypothetical protein
VGDAVVLPGEVVEAFAHEASVDPVLLSRWKTARLEAQGEATLATGREVGLEDQQVGRAVAVGVDGLGRLLAGPGLDHLDAEVVAAPGRRWLGHSSTVSPGQEAQVVADPHAQEAPSSEGPGAGEGARERERSRTPTLLTVASERQPGRLMSRGLLRSWLMAEALRGPGWVPQHGVDRVDGLDANLQLISLGSLKVLW